MMDMIGRSGYTDDCEHLGLWRAAVERAIRGERGQAFLRELAGVMDAMPEKVLIRDELIAESGQVCTIGAVCKARSIDVQHVDYTDPQAVGKIVGISKAMAAEIEFMNDEWERHESPEARWLRMRQWVRDNLKQQAEGTP